jgi:hypothetical protein
MSVLNGLSGSNDERKETLEHVHALYAQYADLWQLGIDAYEGSGGFLDGSYLDRYPAELSSDFDVRRQAARYHNFVESLVDLYTRHLFSQGVDRESKNEALNEWWSDVTGNRESMDDVMRQATAMALASSHVGILIDKTREEATGPTKADEQARVFATIFPPGAILDWRLSAKGLEGVKLHEAVEQPSITEPMPEGADAKRYLLWDTEAFARYASDGEPIGEPTPSGLNLVPLAILRPKPVITEAMIGRPLVGNHNIVRALYNRSSEEDGVLRDQAFSQLVIGIEKDAPPDTVTETQTTVEANYGTKRAMVVRGQAAYLTPDMAAPTEIRNNIQFLIRELFRAAHAPFDQDSREAESAEALALKRKELNEMLQGVAAALDQAEQQIARFYFAWTEATAEAAAAAFDAAQVSIRYPREFMLDSLLDDLEAWAKAVATVRSDTFKQQMEKRIVRRSAPDLTEELLKAIDQEIETQPSADMALRATGQGLRDRAAARLGPMLQAGQKGPQAPPEAA